MTDATPPCIVWLKRDLRSTDHAPLAAAGGRPVIPLYVVEPELWRQPDLSARQYAFLAECLAELRADLLRLGLPLVVRTGDVVEVLEDVRARTGAVALLSHAETGNLWTFARDRRVAAWARARGVAWQEFRQTGVERPPRERDGWARRWERFMRRPLAEPAAGLGAPGGLDPGDIPTPEQLGLAADPCPGRQRGGRQAALETLHSFLEERGEPYQRAMSAPAAGARHCSRLSPHLAFGTLSMREVLQAGEARLAALRALPPAERGRWPAALSSFLGRLRWHCHFIQKLESEPCIEQASFHPAYDGLRRSDEARLAAWAAGMTGWPFVDACMRSLRATGWLNFRMRAMLMAVASYQLWLPWRDSGLVLARLFTDYEPGIHWPQCQMQSATTGINTIRIYNPVKQGLDHDADGAFIRRWVPELARVPARWLHQPWRMPPLQQADAGCVIGRDYPTPLVDHVAAARAARDAVWQVRRTPGYREIADAIQRRHGSRRSGITPPAERRAAARRRADPQLGLDL